MGLAFLPDWLARAFRQASSRGTCVYPWAFVFPGGWVSRTELVMCVRRRVRGCPEASCWGVPSRALMSGTWGLRTATRT